MTAYERRYDIDWLRVIAIGLLIIYHIGIAFQPWGVFLQFIQNHESLDWLWAPMSMLNIWRIPLLFYVSGMGVCFALKKRSWKQLIQERMLRILVPFIFGIIAIVPIHNFIWQLYYKQDITYNINPSHLWFLANIFIYVLLLTPIIIYHQRNSKVLNSAWIKRIFGKPIGLLVIIIAFVCEAILIKPETYETYAMNLHGSILGFLAFLFGYFAIFSGKEFWITVMKWRLLITSVAIGLFTIRYFVFDLQSPNYLMAIESNLWIFALFGFGYKHLNKPGKILSYLSKSAYPVYILHMIFLYLGSYLIIPLSLPAFVKFVLIVIFTMTGCLATYEFLIRRIKILKPLFGVKV